MKIKIQKTKRKKVTQRNSPLFTRAHLYTLKGVCVLRRLLAEGISANADIGELHSPTEINFLPLVYFPKEIGQKAIRFLWEVLSIATVKTLEKDFGFKIKTIQTDNGREFCNDREQKKSLFEKVMKKLGIEYIRTRPYSPWQNGVVERSHKIDNELFYSRRRFKSEEEMYKSFKRYSTRTNNIARRVLKFRTPNEMVENYFKSVA